MRLPIGEGKNSVPRGCKRVGGGQGRGGRGESNLNSSLQLFQQCKIHERIDTFSLTQWFLGFTVQALHRAHIHPTVLLDCAAGLKRQFVCIEGKERKRQTNMHQICANFLAYERHNSSQNAVLYI